MLCKSLKIVKNYLNLLITFHYYVMKKIIALLILLNVSMSFAQDRNKIDVKKDGDLTLATYYYDNGVIEQQGTFNADGKLHGVWTSYDMNGKKLTVGNYVEGKKVGKWLFWFNDKLREVEYRDSKISSVSEWTDKVKVAVNK